MWYFCFKSQSEKHKHFLRAEKQTCFWNIKNSSILSLVEIFSSFFWKEATNLLDFYYILHFVLLVDFSLSGDFCMLQYIFTSKLLLKTLLAEEHEDNYILYQGNSVLSATSWRSQLSFSELLDGSDRWGMGLAVL